MKIRRNLFISVVMIALVAVSAWPVHRWQLQRALARYQAQLAAQGEKLTFVELRAGWKPPAHDSTELFVQAVQRLGQIGVSRTNQPSAMQMLARGKAAPGWKMPAIFESGRATNSWEELESDLAAKRDAIELLHAITEHPEFDFGLHYETGFSLLLPHLSQTRDHARTLGAAAALELRKGNIPAATEHIRAMLALSKGFEREPIVISQLVRIAAAQIALDEIWDLLQSPAVTEAELRQLQTDLAALEFVAGMERGFECERAMIALAIERMRATGDVQGELGRKRPAPPVSGPILDVVKDRAERYFSPKVIRERAVEITYASTSSYHDELTSLKAMQVLLTCARSVKTNAPFRAALAKCDESLAALGIEQEPENSDRSWIDPPDLSLAYLHRMFVKSPLALCSSLKRVEAIEARRALTVTAIALHRHHLVHGEYPGDLAALAPEFLSALPRDPVDGQPLRYRRSAGDSFVLYSVGEDGKDDNGDPTPTDDKSKSLSWQVGRDWVWPQPATAEEIATYYREQVNKRSR